MGWWNGKSSDDETLDLKTCVVCGQEFRPKGDWQTHCFTCFMATPKGQAWAERKRQEAEELKRRAEAQYRAQQNSQNPYGNPYQGGNPYGGQQYQSQQDWYEEVARAQRKRQEEEAQRQRERYRQQAPPSSARASGSLTIDKDMLRKLLMLCHPDKHGNSDLSNSVTAELLKMRKELK